MIVEYAVHGSLIDYVRLSRNEENVIDFKYTKRLSIALDVAKGMAYLTEKRVRLQCMMVGVESLVGDFVSYCFFTCLLENCKINK